MERSRRRAPADPPAAGDHSDTPDWLFSLGRAQCLRDGAPADGSPRDTERQERGGEPSQMAARAVLSIPPPEREALALNAWHGLSVGEVSAVVGLAAPAVTDLLRSGRTELQRGVAVEVLAGRDASECAERSAILAGGPAVEPSWRDRLLAHAADCPDCAPHLPREVSAAKVFSLLPFPVVSDAPVGELPMAELAAAAERGAALAAGLAAAQQDAADPAGRPPEADPCSPPSRPAAGDGGRPAADVPGRAAQGRALRALRWLAVLAVVAGAIVILIV